MGLGDMAWWKPFLAAAAGRALLLLEARRDHPVTWQRILGIMLFEPPIIAAFGILGWHLFGSVESENNRVVFTLILAWAGQRGLDLLLSRIIPPSPPRDGDKP